MEQLTYRMLHVQLVVSNMIKCVSGDSSSLCQDVCDGTTNVPNAARTACGEYLLGFSFFLLFQVMKET